ncbi:ATP synthase subunit I [Lacrimispora sp. 210928-DFI.3.58]|uniref:ATP synthase subunit I n=1 Tax=Lacrimispora sp. 210928-DFI.3.58 TaxID=2883214 RepID=UPI001D07AF23|nr:ATP synthase subunit I [Lacrimispora sp. 210928-DFI.3.58]MCB7320223.1 ATP synthase subunit I [Lacrimispora sp. 210928-DFI.3.58]
MQIQPAVKKETAYIAGSTIAGTCVMILAFWALHQFMPDTVPFDYKVILGGILGSAVAAGNFFFMGLTVQKIANTDNQDEAYKSMKASYRFRTLTQLLWVVLAMVLPVLNGAAGIIPLFFPSLCIKARSILGMIKAK